MFLWGEKTLQFDIWPVLLCWVFFGRGEEVGSSVFSNSRILNPIPEDTMRSITRYIAAIRCRFFLYNKASNILFNIAHLKFIFVKSTYSSTYFWRRLTYIIRKEIKGNINRAAGMSGLEMLIFSNAKYLFFFVCRSH